jgi:hypothetical protein
MAELCTISTAMQSRRALPPIIRSIGAFADSTNDPLAIAQEDLLAEFAITVVVPPLLAIADGPTAVVSPNVVANAPPSVAFMCITRLRSRDCKRGSAKRHQDGHNHSFHDRSPQSYRWFQTPVDYGQTDRAEVDNKPSSF